MTIKIKWCHYTLFKYYILLESEKLSSVYIYIYNHF